MEFPLEAREWETESGCSVLQISQQRWSIGVPAYVQLGQVQNLGGAVGFDVVDDVDVFDVGVLVRRLDDWGCTRRLRWARVPLRGGAVEDLVGLGEASDLLARLVVSERGWLGRVSGRVPKARLCMPMPRGFGGDRLLFGR